MANFITEISEREKVRAEKLLNEKPKIEVPEAEVPVTNLATDSLEQDKQPVIEYIPSKTNDKIVFKVQIGSFLNGKLTPAFKTRYNKLSKFRTIDKHTDAKKYAVYTIGNFTNYKDASLLKNQLIMEGAKGAFLAAFKNGVRIPVASVVKEIPSK